MLKTRVVLFVSKGRSQPKIVADLRLLNPGSLVLGIHHVSTDRFLLKGASPKYLLLRLQPKIGADLLPSAPGFFSRSRCSSTSPRKRTPPSWSSAGSPAAGSGASRWTWTPPRGPSGWSAPRSGGRGGGGEGGGVGGLNEPLKGSFFWRIGVLGCFHVAVVSFLIGELSHGRESPKRSSQGTLEVFSLSKSSFWLLCMCFPFLSHHFGCFGGVFPF